MNARGQVLVVLLHVLIGLAVLTAATTLTALHDPITSTLASLFGIILGLAGAGAATVSSLGSALNGKMMVTSGSMQSFADVLGQAVDHLGHAPAVVEAPAEPPAETHPGPAT